MAPDTMLAYSRVDPGFYQWIDKSPLYPRLRRYQSYSIVLVCLYAPTPFKRFRKTFNIEVVLILCLSAKYTTPAFLSGLIFV